MERWEVLEAQRVGYRFPLLSWNWNRGGQPRLYYESLVSPLSWRPSMPVSPEKDTVELYLDGIGDLLPQEALAALSKDLEAAFCHHLEVEKVNLVTGRDKLGKLWLRVAVVLGRQ